MKNFVRPRLGFYWYLFEGLTGIVLGLVLGWTYFRASTSTTSAESSADWLSAGATLFATFVGATLAFGLESIREQQSKRNRDEAAGQIAFFKLSRMLNRLASYRQSMIDPWRGDPTNFLGIRASIPIDSHDLRLDMDSLHFLFKHDANLLGEIAIEQDQYVSVIDLINHRSLLHREKLQPRLMAANLPEEFEVTTARLAEILSPGLIQEAINTTNDLIESVDKHVLKLEEITNLLGIALSKVFPSGKRQYVVSIDTEDSVRAD